MKSRDASVTLAACVRTQVLALQVAPIYSYYERVLASAPWLSWSKRPTVKLRKIWHSWSRGRHREILSSTLSGAVSCFHFLEAHVLLEIATRRSTMNVNERLHAQQLI